MFYLLITLFLVIIFIYFKEYVPKCYKDNIFRRKKIAIVGSGIAGLSCGYMLSKYYDCTLFEESDRLGGVARTIEGVDTGVVYIKGIEMYPYLTRFFKEFNIETRSLPITLSVTNIEGKKDWISSDVENWTPEIKEEIMKFDKLMNSPESDTTMSIRLFCLKYKFSNYFMNHIIPCILGMILHRDTMTTFMFKTIYKSLPLLDVCDWRLPVNGTKEYVKKFSEPIKEIKLNCPVISIERDDKVKVTTKNETTVFDYVIMATPMKINNNIIKDKSLEEVALFNKYTYNIVNVILHNDLNFIKNINTRSYINCNCRDGVNSIFPNYKKGETKIPDPPYILVTEKTDIPINKDNIIDKRSYNHPDYNNIDSYGGYDYRNKLLKHIQGKNNTFYCGQDTVNEYWHELVLQSGLHVANLLGVPLPFSDEGFKLFLPFNNIIGFEYQ